MRITIVGLFILGYIHNVGAQVTGLTFEESVISQASSLPERDSEYGYILNTNKNNCKKIKKANYYRYGNKIKSKSFDKSGNLVLEEDFMHDRRIVYTYNSDNRLTKVTTYRNGEKKPSHTKKMSYDKSGNLINAAEYNKEGVCTNKTTHVYDTDGRELVKADFVGDQLMNLDSTVYSNGNMVYKSQYSYSPVPDEKPVITKDYYYYNDRGLPMLSVSSVNNVIAFIAFSDYGKNGKLSEFYSFSSAIQFDVNTNRWTKVVEDKYGKKVTLKYDDQGRVVEKKQYRLGYNGLSSFTGERKSLVISDSLLEGRKVLMYNENGTCTKEMVFQDSVIYTTEYNESGYIKAKSSNTSNDYRLFVYDETCKLVEEIENIQHGANLARRHVTYQYDRNGNNTRIMETYDGNTYFQFSSFKFDDQNNLIEVIDSNKQKNVTEAFLKIEYTYYK